MSRSRGRLAADWFAKLRTNLITDEVEHLALEAEKEATAVALALTMVKANNLSGLTNVATARTNLSVDAAGTVNYVDTRGTYAEFEATFDLAEAD